MTKLSAEVLSNCDNYNDGLKRERARESASFSDFSIRADASFYDRKVHEKQMYQTSDPKLVIKRMLMLMNIGAMKADVKN